MTSMDPLLVAAALLVAALLLLWLRLDHIHTRANLAKTEALLKQARADLAALRTETTRLQLDLGQLRAARRAAARAPSTKGVQR